MKNTLNFTLLLLCMTFLVSKEINAQNPVYRMVANPSGTAGSIVIYIDWTANASNTNASAIAGRTALAVQASAGTPNIVNVQGTWSIDQTFTQAFIDGIFGAADNPNGYSYMDFNTTATMNFGNVAAGVADTILRLYFPNAGDAELIDGINGVGGSSNFDNNLTGAGLQATLMYRPTAANSYTTTALNQSSPIVALPVDLVSFDVNAYNTHDAILDWATASELNNSHFEVQRSFDGYNFTTIDEVKGNGTSHSLINYSYVDETIPPHQNIVYYRLNQVDYNGESELSDVRLVQFEGFSNAPLVVYPNPTKSETTILLGDNVSQGEYTITDLVGKQWMADIVRAGSKSIELDFTNLPSGVYIATLNTENDSKHVRIVKK